MSINEQKPEAYLGDELNAKSQSENYTDETPFQNPKREKLACGHKPHKEEPFCRKCGGHKNQMFAEMLGQYDIATSKQTACVYNIKRASRILEQTSDPRTQDKQRERIQYWREIQESAEKTRRELAEYLTSSQSQTNGENDVMRG